MSFKNSKVPYLFFFSGLHSDYHKPSDTWDKINAADAADLLRLTERVALRLDKQPERLAFIREAEPAPPAGMGGGGGGYGAWFGSTPDFGEVENGVRFADVREGSPAALAGFRAGDILIEFDGKPIKNLYDFTYVLRAHKPGDEVEVVVLRGAAKVKARVKLARRPG
jgi:C-terminal processing protease CtpA/Prc